MPKYEGLTYDFETVEGEHFVVFTKEGVEVRLPIEMGQDVRYILRRYLHNSAGKDIKEPKPKFSGNHAILITLEDLVYQIIKEYSFTESYLKKLNLLLRKRDVQPELAESVKTLINLLRPRVGYVLRTFPKGANSNDTKFIIEHKLTRAEVISEIAACYEPFKSSIRKEHPRSIIVPARPMYEWPVT